MENDNMPPEVDPIEKPEDQSDTAKDTGTETPKGPEESPKKYFIAGREYGSPDEVAKALENANRKITEQGAELGKLRPKDTPPPDPEPEYDPYDPEKVKKWTDWRERQVEVRLTKRQEQERADAEENRRQQSVVKFAEDHPDITISQMQQIAQYGDANGFGTVAEAHSEMVKKGLFKKPDETVKGKRDAADKLPKPKGGGGAGGSEYTAEYIDQLSPSQYGQLPQKIRDAYLSGEL